MRAGAAAGGLLEVQVDELPGRVRADRHPEPLLVDRDLPASAGSGGVGPSGVVQPEGAEDGRGRVDRAARGPVA